MERHQLCYQGVVEVMSREELYQQFGPMLVEAVVLLMLDELNKLRELHGLSVYSPDQLANAISTKLANMKTYAWMDEPPIDGV